MRLIASDFITHHRPSLCELRVWLRHRDEPERDTSVFEEVLHRLGERHEREHLATMGECANLSGLTEDERIKRTLEAIAFRASVIYQPVFRVRHMFGAAEVEILGIPDFLILDGDGYIIRDAKMARRIDEENHPEILLQVQLYGWLFEKSCGVLSKALQVFSGMKEIVAVPYDGGVAALAALERLLAVKQQETEAYEPVGWTKCNPCGFNERCWNKAEANGDIALLPDVDQNLARKLNGMNIRTRKELLSTFDVTDLSELKRPFGAREQRVGTRAERILQFAEAMEKREEKILAAPGIPQLPNYVMFDLEGMPPHLDELDKIYMWGVQVFGDKPSEFMPAVSGFGPNGDNEGWLAFLENAKKVFEIYGDIPFVHWASYEKTYLTKYIQRHGDVDGVAARVIANLLDLLTVTKESIILPVPSFSLKVIEQYVGYKRKQTEYGGQWAMAMFIEATETSDEGKRKELMDEILAYNKEDLEATWAVFEWLSVRGMNTGQPF
ncbi:MAG TPA: TM0106 family RecB-like putative nuclease [Candidatus Binatus sp.]|nr:TM0106 family RecB-like putative nuclease [Candidatus Binatus sp.]